MFIYWCFRERTREAKVQREKPKQTLVISTDPDAGLDPTNHEIMIWAAIKSRILNPLSHPGALRIDFYTYLTVKVQCCNDRSCVWLVKHKNEFIQGHRQFTELWARLEKHSRWQAYGKIPPNHILKWPNEDFFFTTTSDSPSSKAPSVPETWPCSTPGLKAPNLLNSASNLLRVSQDVRFQMEASLG